jgi:TetR/AcrR family transcriptional regulator
VDAQVAASVWVAFALGRLQRFVRTGQRRLPTEHLQESLARLL